MDALADLITWQRIIATGAVCLTTLAVYLATLAIYRLTLHPLARFPGPRLAAITLWYEAYFDVICNGQYTFQIERLHRRYGPIIRISPHELHVSDPSFFDMLYRQDGRWDKYAWSVNAAAAYGPTMFTAGHDLHRARRQPMNSFFSKAKVASRQALLVRHLDVLCDRLSGFAASRKTVDLGAAVTAYVRDVANDFILGKSYNSLARGEFDASMIVASAGGGFIWRLSKHVKFVAPIMMSIPMDWLIKYADENTKVFFTFLKEMREDTMTLRSAALSSKKDNGPRTIVDEIMESSLPNSEKSPNRLAEEASTVTGAGYETTGSALRLIIFHIFTNPQILERLRAEIASLDINRSGGAMDWKTLEQLPYLTSILKEGLRLSPALATRMARIAPDRDLHYGDLKIPAGTPVGMTPILMHTDEASYSDPHDFKPDRWLSPEAYKGTAYPFAPFGKGTRGCLGMHLAWAEMYLLVATLATKFDFKFEGATAEDFRCESDQFIISTKGKGVVYATVRVRQYSHVD